MPYNETDRPIPRSTSVSVTAEGLVGSPVTDERLPLGMMAALARNMHAMQAFAALSEPDRSALIARAAACHSRAEMQALVDGLEK